ncbi:MAG: hypothetical protein EBV69_02070 [Oxalobacteraceae bacterium]|nr:hypothetical protein [Oxalobacteraceae bacterium]
MKQVSLDVRTQDSLWFGKDLSTPEPIPEEAIDRAVALMRSGRLHRYGEQGSGDPEPSLLEQEYAAYVGSKYCVAVSSCGAAMFIALKAALVEDCAHTMGAKWDGRHTGTWGLVGCYSAQTYKHINAGEGGLLVTDDDDVAAQAILMSGCYMMYDQHILRPPPDVFERWKYLTPNFSMRMSNLAAGLLRPQISLLADRARRWNHIYSTLARELSKASRLVVPIRNPKEEYVASSIQFTLDLTAAQIECFLSECSARGLYIKWFGTPTPIAFTSNYEHWHYMATQPDIPKSKSVLNQLFDLRTPISLTDEECVLIGRIVSKACSIAEAN